MFQRPSLFSNRARGFTLIELLVVIAIIAILAAILFPVFAQAREKARESACLNNTKQMAIAVQTYMDDWDGSYPSSDRYPSPSPAIDSSYGYGFWMLDLQPYLKTVNIFACPSSSGGIPGGLPASLANIIPTISYSYNEYIAYTNNAEARSGGVDFTSESGIPNVSATALIADGYSAALFHDWDDGSGDPNSYYIYAPDHIQLPSGMMRIKWNNGNPTGKTLVSRHNGANIVYCDAHARYMPLPKFYAKDWTDGTYAKRIETPVVNPGATPGP